MDFKKFIPQGLLGRFVVVILGFIVVATVAKMVAWIMWPLIPFMFMTLLLTLACFVVFKFFIRRGI